MDTSKIVGEKIKALREDKSISIEELAQRSGLAIEQVERIENNIDIPSLAPLIKIARVLGVRLGTFLDDQDEVGRLILCFFTLVLVDARLFPRTWAAALTRLTTPARPPKTQTRHRRNVKRRLRCSPTWRARSCTRK